MPSQKSALLNKKKLLIYLQQIVYYYATIANTHVYVFTHKYICSREKPLIVYATLLSTTRYVNFCTKKKGKVTKENDMIILQ